MRPPLSPTTEVSIDAHIGELSRWLERTHAGEAEAQARLVEEIGGLVRATARRSLRNPQDVEDLEQNIFLAIFRGLSTYRGEAHFRAWLTAVARNESRKFLRRRRRREDPVRHADREPDRLPGRSFIDRQSDRRLFTALRQIPAADREALERVVFDGLSYAEAGELLGCSPGAIRGRIFRARRQLRRLLDRG
ncbi:MAG: sigma-70 family RNA polymerase sigma factor [Acidobacteriota bacterium]